MSEGRLPLLKAAYVIARRDFVAILFSRAFIFFLLGPLFPVAVGAIAGGIGAQVEAEATRPYIGVAMQAADVDAVLEARSALAGKLGGAVPDMAELARLGPGAEYDARTVLERREGNLAAVLTGTPDAPILTGSAERIARWQGAVSLIAADAARASAAGYPEIRTEIVASSGANDMRARTRTAQAGQLLMFLLTMLLAGMVLSNLVEEKGNKIIEILAAAIPMDAVFLGKLFAMLAVSMVGIAVWSLSIGAFLGLPGLQGMFGGSINLSALPEPGVGWPLFFALGVAYFAMAYLLLGAVFLAIGSLATTVREVQTLSMPVTMLQVFLFLFATFAMSQPGKPVEWAAIAFPFSSPFAMIARAAQDEALWPHALALGWQIVCVGLSIKLGAALFRRRVMKSGPATRKRWWRRAPTIAEPRPAE